MRRLRIGIIDLIAKRPTRDLFQRIMNANFASIMPQVLGVWAEQDGHHVSYVCYTGYGDLRRELPEDVDVVFIGAFTQAAQLAYAISNWYRTRGVVTALGGPHARSYPEDASRYFDYVLGFTDREIFSDITQDCVPHRPLGMQLSATGQPAALPGVRERWKFIEQAFQKAPFFRIVPMTGSFGCPYSCPFCTDSTIPYQPLDFDQIREDLSFLLRTLRRPHVGWHDPNFGIRFDDYMEVIEEAGPPNSIDFIAESNLALLTESRVTRLRKNGFRAILPGIETWFDLGEKSRTGRLVGMEKVRQVSEHVNMILEQIPYVHTNFVLGLDADEGTEPFELTKRFIELTPGAFPGYALLTAFGRGAPLNLELQRTNRVLAFPFHFLTNSQAMNVRPKHYTWPEFYDHVIDLTEFSHSWPRVLRRFKAMKSTIPRVMNLVRAVTSEGHGRVRWYRKIRFNLENDRAFRDFFEGETDRIPEFFVRHIRRDLGPFWDWLPEGALYHDAYSYAREEVTHAG